MSRYYFDIHDGSFLQDDHGIECADYDAMRREAKRVLPAIACETLTQEGDAHTITVRVCNEQHQTVYTAVLNFTGISTG